MFVKLETLIFTIEKDINYIKNDLMKVQDFLLPYGNGTLESDMVVAGNPGGGGNGDTV